MPIDSEQEPDLIVSDIAELEDDARLENDLRDNPLVTCSFDCTEIDIKKCRKCSRNFCIMHSNRFSPNFCKDCFQGLACIESKFVRTFEEYNEDIDQVTIHKQTCTKYYMDGPDWPHLQVWINTLTDSELKEIWRFHFFVMKSIESENEVRKINKLKKLREQPTPKIHTKTVLKKTVQVDTSEELRKRLKKQGIPDVVINQMIQAMNKKNP